MGKIFKKEYLFVRISIGFIVGVVLGLFAPNFGSALKPVGDLYITLIKMMIVPIIFCSVTLGITNMKSQVTLRKIGLKTIFIYVVMFIVAMLVSMGIAYLMRPGNGLIFDVAPTFDGELVPIDLSTFLLTIVPANILNAMSTDNIVGLIFFTALFGIAAVSLQEKAKPALDFIKSLSEIFFKILDYVMETSPIGVMALMAFTAGTYGPSIFAVLGKYILTAYIACIVSLFVVIYPIVFAYTKMSLIQYLKSMYKIWLVTFSTTSSAASMPTAMKVSVEEFKTDETITDFVIPLGTTLSKVGGACSFACLTIFALDFYGQPITLSFILIAILVSTLLNMAAPGVPGGGIVLGATYLSILGLPVDIMGPIGGIYRLLDMVYTSLNVTGNVATNIAVSASNKDK